MTSKLEALRERNEMKTGEPAIVAIDLETTGLDPRRARASILEVCAIVLDDKLNEIAMFHRYVQPDLFSWKGPDDWEVVCEPAALRMHERSGLLRRVEESGVHVGDMSKDLVAFLRAHNGGDNRKLMLFGNSIGALDIPFLREHAPAVLAEVHYRTIDVSAFRNATKLAFGTDYAYEKKLAHTAEADIRESIAEFKYIARGLARANPLVPVFGGENDGAGS